MDLPTLHQALPGVLITAALAFPMLFFPKWQLVYRLTAACGMVLVCLAIFGQLLGHQFHFLRPEDILLEVIGIGVALLLSTIGRMIRKIIAKKREHV